MRRLTITAVCVLQAIADGYQYGFDIIDQTQLPSGTVYPALGRLERDGWSSRRGKTSRTRTPRAGRRAAITS